MCMCVNRICVLDLFGGACGDHISDCAVRVYGLLRFGENVPIYIRVIAVRNERC